MHRVFWDIETRSGVNLRDHGSYSYATDSTTQVLCLVYAIDDGKPELWLPSDPVPAVFQEIATNPKDWQLVAHNWEFERAILEQILIPRRGFPAIPLEAQHCSQRLALANAYPAELDLLAQALGLPYRKDRAARKAMLAVSRPKARKRKATTIPTWDEDAAKLALLYERCKLDTITTRAVWQSPKLKHLSTQERYYQLQDATINARGVRCDRTFATAAMELAINERIAINLKLEELTHGTITSANQVKRFLEAINTCGHAMTTLNKRAVAQVLAGKPDGYVRQLLELRRTAARASVNKFRRLLAYASPTDDRMRGTLRMYGGGPGRWASLGPQLQNLKKNESNLPLSVVDSIRAGDRAGTRADVDPIDDPALVEREDDQDYVATLADNIAPLTELVGLPLTPDNKVACPFHDDAEPSCTIYPDHFHCFGCGEHGNRLDWLTRVEGLTETEAINCIKDWPSAPASTVPNSGADAAEKLAFIKSIWTSAGPLIGSMAELYLDQTRHIDITKLPADLHHSLRFHPKCVFGSGTYLPCLIALMRDPLTDKPIGIQRIVLEDRGGKIVKLDRRMLGHAGVVKIWPAGPQLVIGEGLETVLAAATRILYAGDPLVPAWAALSSKKLAALPVIPSVERLILLIDNDSNQEGQQAARRVANGWRAAGRTVVSLMPTTPDSDFNDVVINEGGHATAA